MKTNAIIVAAIMFLTACAHQGGYASYDQSGSGVSPGQTTPLDTTRATVDRFDTTVSQSRPQSNVSSAQASGFTGQEGTASASVGSVTPAGHYGSIDSSKSIDLPKETDRLRPSSGELSVTRSGNRPKEEFESNLPTPTQSNRDLGEQSRVLNQTADLPGSDSVGAPPATESGRSSSGNSSLSSGTSRQISAERSLDRDLSDQVRVRLHARTPGTLGTLSTDDMKDVQVSSMNGRVTLKGSVGSDVEKQNIESRALKVPGVLSVDNQLKVKPDGGFDRRDSSDRINGKD